MKLSELPPYVEAPNQPSVRLYPYRGDWITHYPPMEGGLTQALLDLKCRRIDLFLDAKKGKEVICEEEKGQQEGHAPVLG